MKNVNCSVCREAFLPSDSEQGVDLDFRTQGNRPWLFGGSGYRWKYLCGKCQTAVADAVHDKVTERMRSPRWLGVDPAKCESETAVVQAFPPKCPTCGKEMVEKGDRFYCPPATDGCGAEIENQFGTFEGVPTNLPAGTYEVVDGRMSLVKLANDRRDTKKGVYKKFEVTRVDGRDGPGLKHERCRYFVIDLNHDEFAADTLIAYADACGEKFPKLADDLFNIAEEIDSSGFLGELTASLFDRSREEAG